MNLADLAWALLVCYSLYLVGVSIVGLWQLREKSSVYKKKSVITSQDSKPLKTRSNSYVRESSKAFSTHLMLLTLAVMSLLAANVAFAQVTFKDKAECEANYNACSTTLFQWVFRGQECEESLWQALCDEHIAWQGGQRGGLWKPVSESTGRPTILLPQEYQDKQVMLLSPTGKLVATAPFRRLTNPDRATFDVSTSNLPFETRVVIVNGDKVECRYVLDPSKRYE